MPHLSCCCSSKGGSWLNTIWNTECMARLGRTSLTPPSSQASSNPVWALCLQGVLRVCSRVLCDGPSPTSASAGSEDTSQDQLTPHFLDSPSLPVRPPRRFPTHGLAAPLAPHCHWLAFLSPWAVSSLGLTATFCIIVLTPTCCSDFAGHSGVCSRLGSKVRRSLLHWLRTQGQPETPWAMLAVTAVHLQEELRICCHSEWVNEIIKGQKLEGSQNWTYISLLCSGWISQICIFFSSPITSVSVPSPKIFLLVVSF